MFDLSAFRDSVDAFLETMNEIPENKTSVKTKPDAWSLKEIVGHLVDSASNNHQRFIRLQEADLGNFPAYDGEKWILLAAYNDFDWESLKDLWYRYNQLLLHMIEKIDSQALSRKWKVNGEERSLEWLVNDYYRHLLWHRDHFARRRAELETVCD